MTPLDNKEVIDAIASGESQLGGIGRLLVRASGTEPLIRVMAEAEDEGLVAGVVTSIVEVIERVSADVSNR